MEKTEIKVQSGQPASAIYAVANAGAGDSFCSSDITRDIASRCAISTAISRLVATAILYCQRPVAGDAADRDMSAGDKNL